jgi:hypothetical protein
MSYREFTGWKERYETQPWGPEADDRRHVDMQLSLTHIMMSNGAEFKKIDVEGFSHNTLKQKIINIDRLTEGVPEGGLTEAQFRDEQNKQAAEGVSMMADFAKKCGVAIT